MNLVDVFFIVMSICVIIYILSLFQTKKRIHLLVEIFFLVIYACVLLFFLFPGLTPFIETTLGITSALNFLLALSVFIAYFILFLLYTKSEEQRMQITKLTQEIAFMKKNESKKK